MMSAIPTLLWRASAPRHSEGHFTMCDDVMDSEQTLCCRRTGRIGRRRKMRQCDVGDGHSGAPPE